MNSGAWLLIGMLIALAIPPTSFAVSAVNAGMGADLAMQALLEQLSAERQNLLVCSLLGLFPVALLASILWLAGRLGQSEQKRISLAGGGLLPILLVLAWANFEFWPIFLPERVYPGFPHGLELVLGPGLYAPLAMLIGLVAAWIVTPKDP